MDFKHFSHPHNLTLHQHLPGCPPATCSGCNFEFPAISGATMYTCWPCQFFLHDECFKANRSLHHPLHPSHPLALLPYPTYPSASFFCNSCGLSGTGFSYSCPNCEFDLHLHCAKYTADQPYPHANSNLNYSFTPNQTLSSNKTMGLGGIAPPPGVRHFSHDHPLQPAQVTKADKMICSGCEKDLAGAGQAYECTESNCNFYLHKSCFGLRREIRHKSHPSHPLVLLPSPPYLEEGIFTCNACVTNGNAFCYHCSSCHFDLHADCAFSQEKVKREDHEHPLTLMYSSPYEEKVMLNCEVCQDTIDRRFWGYYCEECDYGTHLGCVGTTAKAPGQEKKETQAEEDSVAAALFELQMLALQSRLGKMNADFAISSCADTVNQLGKIG